MFDPSFVMRVPDVHSQRRRDQNRSRYQELQNMTDIGREHDASRRAALRHSAAAIGGGLLGSAAAGAGAQALAVPESNRAMGRALPVDGYGQPSKFEAHVKRRRSDVLVNRQNFSDWSMTPLHQQLGIVTPNGLMFERHHNGVPDIDPDEHRLVIHGMVKQPLVFSMSDLVRYPSVSRFHFLECSGNGLTDWLKAASKTVQQSHGLLSCAQWTGVPVATLLDEARVTPGAEWALAEGADGAGHARSIPMKKMLDDALIVYAANGEMLRPENGYPLRLFIPGWEGNVSVKWLRRIKLGSEPWNLRSETARYTDPLPGGRWRQFSFEMEAKSVITSPSGDMRLKPGPLEIVGLRGQAAGAFAMWMSRSTADARGAKRRSKSRCSTNASPASACRGSGTVHRR
jgi:sulfane dehydrogenase subunit SoxC